MHDITNSHVSDPKQALSLITMDENFLPLRDIMTTVVATVWQHTTRVDGGMEAATICVSLEAMLV